MEFLEQADAICAKTSESVRNAGEKNAKENPSSTAAEFEKNLTNFVTETIVPEFEKELKEVAALDAPAKDNAKLEEVLTEFQKGLDQAKAAPTKIFSRPNPSLVKAGELSKEYGFARCGSLG